MTPDAEHFAAVAQGFSTRLEAVAPEMWDVTSVCPHWRVRDLVSHVVANHRRTLARLDGADAETVDADGDLTAAWLEVSRDLADALGDEARAGTRCAGPSGEQRFDEMAGGLLSADTLVHTWDLARSTGLDETLDSSCVERALSLLAAHGEALRGPTGLGPAIEPARGADPQTRLLNLCGRTVSPPDGRAG